MNRRQRCEAVPLAAAPGNSHRRAAVHVHEAVVAHHATARFALDLRPDDVFWCTADPGWATGTSHGIIAPLTLGATVIVDSADYEARRWYANLADQKVTVCYTAPTALRMLMRHGPDLPAAYVSHLACDRLGG
jgi:acetyl-CoA synthetase